MPFDPHPNQVTYLPVTLREGGGGGPPVRVHVRIEICGPARKPARSGWRWPLLVALGLLLGSAMARGQPRYEHWQDSRTGAHGQARTEGTTSDWDSYGPRGEQRHCHSYVSGNDRHTTCR
jgi:hypothetical protein